FLSSIFLLFFKRQIALVISIVGIIIYAVLAGLEPSIIRASIMGILVFTASIFGRQTWPLYGLLLAGFVMLMWDPNLLNDIGFQLSFLATIGLLYMKPFFKNKILDGFQTTIFAQAATLPILVSNFGTYSLWSIVVNSLILWTIPLLMVIGGVSAVISFIIFPIAKILLYLSLPLLIFFESVVRFFSGLSGTIKIENLSWQIVLGYYCLLASFILARNK
ncbi:MAG TPA: ComEC/Rec2 family competence protein, partial [Patescibacteria group bacterium]|nr:ComEC/Rec2 family competence protein [Patescibacteria group bacterium]